MVYRIFVEKRPGLSPEAGNLLGDLRGFLGGGEAVPVQPGEARQRLHHRRRVMGPDQGFRFLHGRLPALYGVDEVALNLLQILPARI